jgi:hypothetical protein
MLLFVMSGTPEQGSKAQRVPQAMRSPNHGGAFSFFPWLVIVTTLVGVFG